MITGPAVWLDPRSQKVKLMGVVSYGSGEIAFNCSKKVLEAPRHFTSISFLVPCGEAGIYASVSHVVDWINGVTMYCNSVTCGQNMCVTKDKLMPQALQMLGGCFSQVSKFT